MKKFSQIQQRVGNRFKQRIVPIVNGIYGAYSKLAAVFGNPITISNASDKPLQGLRIFGKSTQNGTPTPDAPVDIVSVENPAVIVRGKNLLNLPQIIEKPVSAYNYDLFTGTSGQSVAVPIEKIELLPYIEAGKTYCFSCKIPNLEIAEGVKVMAVNDDGTIGEGSETTSAILIVNNGTFVPTKSSFVTIRVGTSEAVTIGDIQLELDESTTEYEPYIEAQTIKTHHTLHGIPVTSGGNYTDANGQQWICDEVDFERELHIQRVGKIDLYTDEIINGNYLSTTGKLTEGASVFYSLETPIETPLTADQIAAYKALHTNEPNTTISNNQNAEMEVTYIKN